MKFSEIPTGRLPPEDGSDRREILGKHVSEDFAKIIFRGPKIFAGVIFRKKFKILAGRLPPEDGSDRRETLGKRVSEDFAKMIFRGDFFFSGGHFLEKSKILKKTPPKSLVGSEDQFCKIV